MGGKKKRKHRHSEEQGSPSQGEHHEQKLPEPDNGTVLRLGKDCDYERELRRLQVELVKLQEWIRNQNLRVVVHF